MDNQNQQIASSPRPTTPAASTVGDERMWATFAHLGGLFFSFVAPLIIWLVMKERSSFVDKHGKEALNFQISLIIYWIASFILMFVLIGALLMFALFIFEIIVIIKAAIAANRMQEYRYPLNIRFIK